MVRGKGGGPGQCDGTAIAAGKQAEQKGKGHLKTVARGVGRHAWVGCIICRGERLQMGGGVLFRWGGVVLCWGAHVGQVDCTTNVCG